MLTAKNLERMIELEEKLRAEYQVQLDEKSAEIEAAVKEKDARQAVIDKQLEQISSLSTEAGSSKRTEQLNREIEHDGTRINPSCQGMAVFAVSA